MTYLTKAVCFLVIGLGCSALQAREQEGARENSILLNGPWEFARGDGSEHAESPAGQRTMAWQQVTLPGPFMKWNQEVANQAKIFWVRRNFNVTGAQAESMAVLRWNRIANSAYMKWVLALPDLAGGRVRVRVTPTGTERLDDLEIVVRPRGRTNPVESA